MNTLREHRDHLVTLLTGAGINAAAYLQERPNPPVAIVVPGSPYVTAGSQFGTFKASFTILLITRTATNEVATAALDDMIATTLVAVAGDATFGIDTVDQPSQITVNGAVYLAVMIDVSTTSAIETRED